MLWLPNMTAGLHHLINCIIMLMTHKEEISLVFNIEKLFMFFHLQ